jgi:hypothetical protein
MPDILEHMVSDDDNTVRHGEPEGTGEPTRHSDREASGDQIPSGSQVIAIRVGTLNQLFNAIDPAPFRERDLDPNAEDFIVDWAREIPSTAPLALVVHLDRQAGRPDEAAMLSESIHAFFAQRAEVSRRRLRQLFRRGRTSLFIGLTFLAVSLLLGDLLERLLGERRIGEVFRESLSIGGWVAMWRPMEVFLYDWWPIRADVRLATRLSAMPVRLSYNVGVESDAWRSDWPAVPPPIKPVATAERHSSASERLPPRLDDPDEGLR